MYASAAFTHNTSHNRTNHAFAVRTLVTWYHQGVPVENWLPRLSTYLGHTDPRNTYWYLSAVPELLGLAAQRVTGWQEDRR